jgi:hypothetical protein
LAIQPVVLNHYVLALDVAGLAEGFAERSGLTHCRLGRPALDETHDGHRRLLRARRQGPRPCGAAAKQDNEIAPSYT